MRLNQPPHFLLAWPTDPGHIPPTMRDEFLQKLRMYSTVKTHLRMPAHLAFWLNKEPEIFTTLEAQFETGAGALGAFGEDQSRSLTGITEGQNLAETALEDAASPLGRALRLCHLASGQMDQAAVWDLSLTKWRQLQEQALLTKARALHAAIIPLTIGTTPVGKPYGLTAAKAVALLDLLEDYEAVISQPIAARAGRKAKTSDLRPRVRAVDGLLGGMDDLVVQFRGTAAGNLFVEGYFNARRIGGTASGGEDETPAGPTPTPTPPPPNP